MNDSQRLREEFDQKDIIDGWTIISRGEGGGNYGYGSRDLLMYLEGPDGLIYCQESSCCYCNGIDGSFDPVLTNEDTILKDIVSYEGHTGWKHDAEKLAVASVALEYVRGKK